MLDTYSRRVRNTLGAAATTILLLDLLDLLVNSLYSFTRVFSFSQISIKFSRMIVTLTSLSQWLSKSKEFTIQVKPKDGPGVIVKGTTPSELKAIKSLD